MLAQFIHSLFFFSILLILCSVHITANEKDHHIKSCSNETMDTNFSSDRDKLLNKLRKVANNSDGFFIDSVYPGSSRQLYGLIMCYIEITSESCSFCLDFSTKNAPELCPNSSSVVLSYDWCFLRYSSNNFTSQFMANQTGLLLGLESYADSETLNNTVYTLLESLREKVIQSTSRYAYGKKVDPGFPKDINTAYAIVQCTRDLLNSDCSQCIESAINLMISNCLKGQYGNYRLGCRIVYIGCYIRYMNYKPPLLPKKLGADPPWPSFDVPTTEGSSHGLKSLPTVAGVSAACAAVLILAVGGILLWRRKTNGSTSTTDEEASTSVLEDSQAYSTVKLYSEFKVFDLDTLKLATNNFSDENKLGRGGFGSVYKGTLEDGLDVAVKRLSGSSSQGLPELKNEVDMLAKVKHRNLVQLVGCCIQREEKLLCYELLPNGSLDNFLFANDSIRRDELNWKTRYMIILGICSGLLYLHKESRVKIIHRDLKASNILLDIDMSPKISDFGLARLFEEDVSHKDTSNRGGTLAYMAPEIILHGKFSAKSDVYSFGVLLLEIVTGKRHHSSTNSDQPKSIISYVWKHVVEGKIDQLKDPVLLDVCTEQVTNCIHIGLLCVQEDPTKRPKMESVSVMLSDYSRTIPALPSLPLPYIMTSIISESSESNS